MSDENTQRVLFLAHLLPYPLDGGAKIKSYYTLKRLAEKYEVTLIAFVRSEGEKRYLANLRDLCRGGIETVLIKRSSLRNYTDALKFWPQRKPFYIGRDYVGAMAKAVKSRLAGRRYDVVHIDHLQMAQYVLPRRSPVRLALDHHNVESQIIERHAKTTASRAQKIYAEHEWPKLRAYELEVCRAVDRVLVVSNEDAAQLRRFAPDLQNITVVPIGVDMDYFQPIPRFPDPKTMLSIGTMYWPPNVESLVWFHDSIYPMIKAEIPDVQLKIVGADPVERIVRLADSDKSVKVEGYVEDVRTTAADCAAFIVPLNAGSGMRVKILNAMAMALPIVSTTVGAEGILATHKKNILIADNPDAFARECIKLLKDPAYGTELGEAAYDMVKENYSWEALGKYLLDVYETILSRPARAPDKLKAVKA